MISPVLIGKNGPRNQIWLLAAMSLPYGERVSAMAQIATMVGSNYVEIYKATAELQAEIRQKQFSIGSMTRKATKEADCVVPISQLTPTKAQLMAGKAHG